MAITIKRVKNERSVALHTLKVGDTFLYDNRVGVIASRNGHDFPMELATCREFKTVRPYGKWDTYKASMLSPYTFVLPVSVELTYKVVG